MQDNTPKVITLPAKPREALTGQHQLRVAAYCRVSTKEEDQLNSYEAQKSYYTDKIMTNPDWTMADIFADEGITGTSAKKREDFMRMMRWCRQGKIDLILTKSVSRFSRNTVDCLNYIRMLKSLGIGVYFEKENINSMDESTELMLTMMGAFAQAESESISGNIRAGKKYAMQRGEATIQYKHLYAYEKGADNKPKIIPEQATIVRSIYEQFLRGASIRMIRDELRQKQIPNAAGSPDWTSRAVRSILTNEKYVGDVLMQKTFRQDCISRKDIRNTGQLPMYLIQNNHEAIVERKTFDAVQVELARRNALKGSTQKSAPSGKSCYSAKYALSDRMICGECGTLYRRCTWSSHGKKHIVWRCTSRLDYGRKYCHDSPTVDEAQLQMAILRVINDAMSDKTALIRQISSHMARLYHHDNENELTLPEIDRQLETLAREFDTLLSAAASNNGIDYSERFKAILAQQTDLKAKRTTLEQRQAEDEESTRALAYAEEIMEKSSSVLAEWEESTIRALVASVRVLSKEEVLIRLKSGIEAIQRLT